MLAAETRELLWERIRQVDEHMRRHILAADCVIITLGLTEVFFQQHNGRAICAAPGYGGGGGIGCEFRATEYPENFANIERVIEILREVNPKAQVILTVSPVPLAATWSGVDHAIANTESKSTLRAVAGAIVRRFDNVHYFHSFELVMHADRNTVFKEDGRHVLPEYVAGIMCDFESAFVKPESASRPTSTASGESVSGPSQRKGPHFIDLSQSVRTDADGAVDAVISGTYAAQFRIGQTTSAIRSASGRRLRFPVFLRTQPPQGLHDNIARGIDFLHQFGDGQGALFIEQMPNFARGIANLGQTRFSCRHSHILAHFRFARALAAVTSKKPSINSAQFSSNLPTTSNPANYIACPAALKRLLVR